VTLLKKTRDRPIVRVTMGIIDFFQTWTLKKKMASCIKVLEANKATIPPELYGRRFLKHFLQQVRVGQHLQDETGAKSANCTPMTCPSEFMLLRVDQ